MLQTTRVRQVAHMLQTTHVRQVAHMLQTKPFKASSGF
jgi:hypothetical protein